MRTLRCQGPIMALLLSLPGSARADYQMQPIVKPGDNVGGITIKENAYLQIGALNDKGQLVFVAENAPAGEALFQYASGRLTLIAAGGHSMPFGVWPSKIAFARPVSMNQAGNVAFALQDPGATSFLGQFLGTFRWFASAQLVAPVAVFGMGAGNGALFRVGSYPITNNNDDIAFTALPTDNQGWMPFLLGHDGQLVRLAQSGQALPGGGQFQGGMVQYLNNAGAVAFWAEGPDYKPLGAYLWKKGTITPVVKVGSAAPGGGVFTGTPCPLVNDSNTNVLLLASVVDRLTTSNTWADPNSVYLIAGSEWRPVLVPGQDMPGGGKLQSFTAGFSFPNAEGQVALEGTLDDGSHAVYLVDAEGQLSLVLKEGATTPQGKVTRLGVGTNPNSFGLGLNNKGQVAVPVQIDNGPAAIVLLTPAA